MKVARIAALRPLLPVEALATAMGKKWAAPDDYGCVPGTHRQGFSAQFEEHFGGFNFGSGNAQLDLLKMELDWACG